MKTIRSRNGNTSIQPFKVFPYQSLKDAIQRLILKDKFLDNCEHWRTRTVAPGYLCDIYEGQTWLNFLSEIGSGFLQSRYNLCFTINLDWFQPFTHTRKLIMILFNMYQMCFYRILCWGYLSGNTESATCCTLQEGKHNTCSINSRSKRTKIYC